MPNNYNRNRSRQASESRPGSSADSSGESRPVAQSPASPGQASRPPRRRSAKPSSPSGNRPAVNPNQAGGNQPATGSQTKPAEQQRTAKPVRQQPKPVRQQSSPAAPAVRPAEAAAPQPAVSGQPASGTRSRRRKSSQSQARPNAMAASSDSSTLLKIVPLGGMREIGKNLTVYEYGNDMIIVDCGIAFPEEDMPGIDVVIPDFSYLIRNKEKIRGIFLTHGHEDHIGALPWLCRDIKVPIYGNRLTLELVRLKLEDRGTGVTGVTLHPIKDGVVIPAGPFSVEFIHVNHSIADANALAIRTPAGIIFHSGDFKIDYTPINGGPIDLARIAAIGQEGVLAFVCESTNVERPGHSSSESKVGESFADLFGKATGRIMVATFSSNVFRMQQIFTAAEKYNRKVALIGRSMVNVFNAANSLGYITMRPDTLIDINQLDRYDADEIVIITTGSQGEPMSALTRMAFSEHRRIEILPEDTVIISASPIPGNEKPIYRVINELFKRGAHVVYESLAEIHVSGHAYSGELKLLHSLVRPRYFIPGHGEYRHLYKHAELANQMGVPWANIFLLNNGDMFEYQDGKARIGGFTAAGGVLIDGAGMVDIDNPVLRDRRLLAEDGVVSVFIAVSRESGEMIGEPDIQARGFIYESETDRIIRECKKRIEQFARKAFGNGKSMSAQIQGDALRDVLNTLLFERTKRRPIILISVVEV